MAAGCGGGGGGGVAAPNPLPDPTIPRTLPTDFSLADDARGYLQAINYDPNVGNAGSGVTVAFHEDAVDEDHPTLDGKSLVTLRTGVSGSLPADISHGTLVALLIGGRIMKDVYGSAYESDLEFVCCIEHDADGDFETIDDILTGLEYLADESQAFVVNNSYGYNSGETFSGIDQARCNARNIDYTNSPLACSLGALLLITHRLSPIPGAIGMDGDELDLRYKACVDPAMVEERLCVFSAGNHGLHENGVVDGVFGGHFLVSELRDSALTPSSEIKAWLDANLYKRGSVLALPNQDSRFSGHYLVVAALKTDGSSLAEYSNGCGETKDFCLSAPGDIPFDTCDVATSPSGVCDTYVSSGTSFAAPLVSGAAAVVMSYFRNLNAPVVATILLTTATDLGETGVDDDYGWGRLDLGDALKPSNVQTTSDGVRLTDTHVKAGFSFDAALAASTASFGMFDEHDRPYLHFVASRVSSSQMDPALSIDDLHHSSLALMRADFGARMGLSGSQRGSTLPNMLGLARLSGWDMGLEQCHLSCPSRRDVQIGSLVESSALAWAQHHMQVLGGRIGLVLETGLEDGGGMTYSNRGLFFESGLSEGLLRLEAGMLDEKETFMGSVFSGALGVRPGDSQYISASLGIPVGENAFSAGYTLGQAGSGLVANSYVTEIQDVTYDAYRLAFGGKRWELGYTVPLAAISGGMRVESIGGYTGSEGDWSIVPTDGGVAVLGKPSAEDWSYRQDSHWVDLGSGARERRLGLTMARPHGNWDMTFAVEHVTNSPRESFSGDEARAVVVLSLNL